MLPLAADQTYAKKLANQLFYGTPVEKAGAFYGYSGMGYAGHPEGSNTLVKNQSFNSPFWIVGPDQPRVPVWIVKEEGTEETLQTGVEKRQEELMAVPVPTLALLPHGQVAAFGSDAWVTIWCPATDELWEFHRLNGRFVSGPLQGEWKTGNAHYQAGVSKWNGVTAAGSGQGSASGLCLAAGMITLAELVNVLRGGKIGHALSLGTFVTLNSLVTPARLHDKAPNPSPLLEDKVTPNPAYTTLGPEKAGDAEGLWKEGWADAVPEGTWCRFPPASRASELGMTRPLEVAIYEAIREHGMYTFATGSTQFCLTDAMTLFTPYCDTNINPFNGNSEFNAYVNTGVSETVRNGWIDPTLPVLEGKLNGTSGVLAKMPWRTLELLEPRSS